MTGAPVSDDSLVVSENVIDTPGEVDDPAAAAMARLDAAFGPDGASPVAEGPDDAPDPGGPALTSTPAGAEAGTAASDEDMTYRDAQKLRKENQDYRERWSPFERAFGDLDEASQHQLLAKAPGLGGDLALITDAFADLVPSDRQVIANVIKSIPYAPEAAADALVAIAEELRKDPDALDDEPLGDELDEDLDPRYLTADQFDRRLTSFMQAAQVDAEERARIDEIHRELKDLGYDLESTDKFAQARIESVLALARRLDGNVTAAHEALQEAYGQRTIDEFVEGKAADADRPLPPGAGAPDSGERTLETLGDSEGAMNARLDALFGPPRSR